MIYSKVFAQACHLIEQKLFDARLIPRQWSRICLRASAEAHRIQSSADLALLVNSMLEHLHCSHARLFTKNDIEYFQLLESFGSAMSPKGTNSFLKAAGRGFRGLGGVTELHGKRHFIRWVLDGSPAQRAGLLIGDEIVGVEGVEEGGMRCLASTRMAPVTLQIRRSPRKSLLVISLTPMQKLATDWLYSASLASVKIIHRAGVRIGYLHLWSTSGDAYEKLLREQITSGLLRDADTLLLDLRGLVGGACPSFLSIFCPNIPTLEYIYRNGSRELLDGQWRKPVAFLVNEYTRSGNEVLAQGIRKYRLGELVGAPTAGAVLAGRPYLLADRSLLYLPIADVLVDGKRAEGVRIQPTIKAECLLPYAQGHDEQLEQGVKVLVSKNITTSQIVTS